MKKLFLIVLTVAAVSGYSQPNKWQAVSYADPALSNLVFTDGTNRPVNTAMLTIGTPVKMQFTAANTDPLNVIPAGTCQIKITLGSRFRLLTDLSIPDNLPLGNYFNWSVTEGDRAVQYIIVGELVRDLPARFSGLVNFTLMPVREGNSTTTCQVLISNHNNPNTILSDMTPANNFLSTKYTSLKPIGVKFTRFDAKAHGCTLDLNWSIFDEEKITRRYIIESSDDGINFRTLKTITASTLSSYNLLVEGLSKTAVTLRIKAEMQSGQFVYSGNVYADNICNTRFEAGIYPNPVPAEVTDISIVARSGIFNGKYSISITDISGKELKRTDVTYINQLQVKLSTGLLKGGTYFVSITGEDDQPYTLKLVKQ
jgi:Secretion system C-terminal sorting domain